MINVLLVDDHTLLRSGMKLILDNVSGIKVVGEAKDGEEALKLVRKFKPQVVLMDIKMPGAGGFVATQRILRIDPEIKVLIVTICDNDFYIVRLLQLGASGYLTKGKTSADELVRAIRAVNSGQRYISPEIANRLALRHVSDNEQSPLSTLSERELQVMIMKTKGMSTKEIAEKLCLSTKTVSSYHYRVRAKLNIVNDVQLTLIAVQHDLIEPGEEDLSDAED